MLAIRGVMRAFDGIPVLRGVNLDVARGEIVCLLGPSGCGKTTLLRIVAGLERADAGDVWLEGESILRLPVHLRDFGLMFQDFALFPHMNVIDNVRFGLRMHGVSTSEQLARSQEALGLVGLTGFERRDVAQLSGGERQRVALARSLAPRPRLLMLDEPMGSLDAALRDRLVVEVREIIQRVGLTALYVTHDQAEAYAIADRIAVMNAGRIEQIGTPQDVYRRPQTVFVARFLGLSNIVSVTGGTDSHVETPLGSFQVAEHGDAVLLHPDGLSPAMPDAPGVIIGQLEESTFRGDSYRIQIQHSGGVRLELKWPASIPAPARGTEIAVQVDPTYIIPLRNSAV